jgi:putative spermidine/putrescine transport system substrate-binding protein
MISRRSIQYLAILLSLLLVVACAAPVAPQTTGGGAAAPAAPSTINVYIDSDTNIADWWTNSVKPAFESAHPEYVLNIVHTGAGGGGNGPIADRALAALETGNEPGVDYFETWNPLQPIGAMDAGLWLEITTDNVPNLGNVIQSALSSSTGYDVPYRGSQVLLAYNAERLMNILKEQGKVAADATDLPDEYVPGTWDELTAWICEFPGEFIYPRPDTTGAGRNFVTRAVMEANDLITDRFTVTAFAEQFGSGELTADQIAEINEEYYAAAWDILNEIEPCLHDNGAYPSGAAATTRLLTDELAVMIPIWSDQALQAKTLGLMPDDIRFIQLSDLPMVGGYASSAIPSNATNLDGALALANFMLSSDMQESVVRVIGGFPAVSWDTLPAELREDFNDVITDNVPSFGGPWIPPMYDGWYSFVAPDVSRGN